MRLGVRPRRRRVRPPCRARRKPTPRSPRSCAPKRRSRPRRSGSSHRRTTSRRPCSKPPAPCSPTSTPRATRASATTRASRSSTRSRRSRSNARRPSSASTTRTCSRTPGSPANLAVYLALANAGDTVMGMALPMGGHLTHGWSVSATGTWFHAVQYGVGRESGRVDMDEVREIALTRAAKNHLLWRHGDPPHHRLPCVRRDRSRGRRGAGRRHRAHRRADRRWRAPVAGRARRRHLDDDAQDACAARAARC